LSDIKLNQHHLKAAIDNCRLSGLEVTDDMIINLEQALNDNPQVTPEELAALLLKVSRSEVKIPLNIEDNNKNFITLEEARKRRTPKANRK